MSVSPFPSLSPLQTGAVHEEFYKDCDLAIGGEVNVFGRRVIITDCDDHTKDFYRSKYGRGNQYYCVADYLLFISVFLKVRVLFLQTK